jgi:hypothetical protein
MKHTEINLELLPSENLRIIQNVLGDILLDRKNARACLQKLQEKIAMQLLARQTKRICNANSRPAH